MLPTQHTISTIYPVGPVHCYSAEINGDLILFDTGPPTDNAKHYLRSTLNLEKLKAVIITHCHIDHYGLAAWLEREYGVTIYLPYRDSLKILQHEQRLDGMVKILADVGFEQQFLAALRADIDTSAVFPELPLRHKVAEHDLPAEYGLEVIPCPGHSQSDLVYIGDDWAITGDTMLREIFQSPLLDIDLLTGERFSNYNAYCKTILNLAGLRDKHILPGHREFIVGVDHNICYYVEKLLERTERIKKLLIELTPSEVVEHLFKGSEQPLFVKYLKASEIVFIRDFLAAPQQLRQALCEIDLFSQLEEMFSRVTA